MINVLGIINVTQENQTLQPLINHRCQASIPYGGRYRMIDFILSSMVQSKIKNISIFTPPNSRSLQDHLGSGKDWDLEYKQEGLFIFPKNTMESYKDNGDLSVLYQHLDYLEKSSQEYVLISFGAIIANIDFKPIIQQHIQSDAHVTVVYQEKNRDDNSYANIKIDDFQNVVSFNELQSNYGSLDIFLIDKEKLIQFIKTYAQPGRNLLDVLKQCDFNWNVKGYEYKGYAQRVNSVQDYYQYNMKLLDPFFMTKLLNEPNEIYTKIKDEPPSKHGATSSVKNSIIANGCKIEGVVENSILFQGVHVHKGAVIRNSIIMQKTVIGEQAELDRVIVDKAATISPHEKLMGTCANPKLITKQKIAEVL